MEFSQGASRVRCARRRWRRIATAGAAGLALTGTALFGVGPLQSGASSKPSVPAGALKAAMKYDLGTSGAANPKLSPVSIGWVSDETSLTGHGGNTRGLKAGVDFINDYLGGIKGHPLKLVPCYITTSDAQGASCAEQMLNNSAVKLVLEGELLTGEASFTGTMDGKKPVIGVFTNGPGLTAMNAWYMDGAIQAQLSAVTYISAFLKATSVALIGPDLPGVGPVLGMFQALLEKGGATATVSLYPAAATDLVSAIEASGATTAQAIFLVSSTSSECDAVAQAFKELSITAPVVSLPECLVAGVKKSLGDWPKWTFDFTSINPLSPYNADSDIAAFVWAMDHYGYPGYLTSGYAPLTFGLALTAARWLNQLGLKGYTIANIEKTAAAFTGPMYDGDPHIMFGVQPFPTLGSVRALMYQYLGKGKFKEVTNNAWICPPIPSCTG